MQDGLILLTQGSEGREREWTLGKWRQRVGFATGGGLGRYSHNAWDPSGDMSCPYTNRA